MIQFDDYKKRLQELDHTFRQETIAEMVDTAFYELTKRGVAGLILVPIIYVIGACTTEYYNDYPLLFWTLTILFILTSALRVACIQQANRNKTGWRTVYFYSSVAIGLLLGTYTATSFSFYEDTWTNSIVLFLFTAISGACISSFCIWKRLNQWYIICLIVPSIIVTLFTGPPTMRVIGVFCIIAFGYNYYQVGLWNTNFWFAHVNIYLLQTRIKKQKYLEKGILQERDRAKQANLAKTEFLANMSHELRTPMHGILSYADFGIHRITKVPREKLHEYFYEIADSGNRLMALLNDLLDLAKLEAGKMQYSMAMQDLRDSIHMVTKEFTTLLEQNDLALQVDIEDKAMVTVFDCDRIAQVFRNLLSNSIKFSDEGKTISVSVKKVQECLDESEQQIIKVSVCDQGVGIPEDEIGHVFDKFVQSSKTRTGAGGTGLGLAISKQIVEEHKGRIEVANNPGGGSIFSFYLPVARRKNDVCAS